jgi:hypothetical protein
MTPDDLIELLTEAAVEISNYDSPDNPIVVRIRLALAVLTMEELAR